MRFSTLSAIFLAISTTVALPLDVQRRQEDVFSSLELRGDVAHTGGALGFTARSYDNWLERRSGAKTAANKAARKQRKVDAKTEVQKARRKGGNTAAATKKADQRTAAQAKHNQLRAAGREHKNTKDLPNRSDTFHVAAGNGKPQRTYTGKDVRKANFASHIKNTSGNRFGKTFNNNPHDNPGTSGTAHPIPGMHGSGHEHPLSSATTFSQMKKDHRAEPARIISQTDSTSGDHSHKGAIAHDQSRPAGSFGENDHFLLHPTPVHKPAPLNGLEGTIFHHL